MRFLFIALLVMLKSSRAFQIITNKPSVNRLVVRSSLLLFGNTKLSMSTSATGHLAVHVRGKITPGEESSDIFYRNTLQNSKMSILEDGISRFDVLNRIDNNDEFLLVEVYNSERGPSDHKLTAHYNSWRENVADLMAQPRSASKYTTIFPPKNNWKTDASASLEVDPTCNSFMRKVPWSQEPFTGVAATKAGGTPISSLSMVAVAVDITVTEGGEEAFIAASIENCKNSIKEPGVTRFDFMQNTEDSRNFQLFEVYNNPQANIDHKATAHYAVWAAAVKDLMAVPRTAVKYATRFPSPLYWHRNSFLTHQDDGEDEGAMRGLSAVSGQSFSFLGPKISIGRGIAVSSISNSLKELGIKKPFIITGFGGFNRLKDSLLVPSGAISADTDSNYEGLYCLDGEPTVENARDATLKAVAAGCDGLLCLGGGSALDLGKAVAALVTNKGDIYDYLEVVGKGIAITNKPLPMIAVPTTSGTGSEVTKNAVLKSTEHGRKVSMRHDSMLPEIAIIDPSLTLSCPLQVTAHVGLDTLCQVIEPYISNAANPIVDALAKEGILRASRSLRAVVANGQDLNAREDLAVASVLGGLSLANAKLGAVHGYAAVLGGMFDGAPHGAICAVLLPFVFRKNAEKLEFLALTGDLVAGMRLSRCVEVARIVTGLQTATIGQGATWLEVLVKDLNVPSLSNICSIQRNQIREIAEATAQASSTKGNPVVLTIEELEEILNKAF